MREEILFSSCKMFFHHFRIGKATCLQILHGKLGLKKNPPSFVASCPIDQQEERKSVIFKAPSDAIDGAEGERLSMDDHR
jgi:hypothetical protein